MKYFSYLVRSLWVSGLVVPSRSGDLAVVVRQNGDLDWELIYQSSEPWEISPSVYDLDMHGPDGEFAGSAILIRSDGRSHVFRGSEPLSGLPSS